MTGLNGWLNEATRRLSKASAGQVRTEIQEHYESAREAAISGGAAADEADRLALSTLGDARVANRQYRRVLLTSSEARMLREGSREARFVCSRHWMKWSLLAIPVATLSASAAYFLTGADTMARLLLMGGIAMCLFLGAPFLPVYTVSRGRIFRGLKWAVLIGVFVLGFGSSWLTIACLWPLAWVEWTRISIRRKLPAAKWPKQLYL